MTSPDRSGRRKRSVGGRRASDVPRHAGASPLLIPYTAFTIVAGVVMLAVATATVPLGSAIGLGDGSEKGGALFGLGYWVVVGLVGSLRVAKFRGHGVLTFHLPFVVAAMTLGGPAAAGWVALLGTTERREIREVPWYGVLANHFGLAVSAIAGGFAMDVLRSALAAAGAGGSQSGDLLAVLVGTVVLTTLSIGLALGVVVLRDRLTMAEFFSVYDGAHRSTAPTEAVLGWLLALVYRSVGWWAPIVCAVLVLVIWDAHAAREASRRDPLSGLLNRAGLSAHLERAVRRARRGWEAGAIIAIDLDGFKGINDTFGHDAGDAVIRATGERLTSAIRMTDAAARMGGDEFTVVLLGVDDEPVALALAHRLLATLRAPVAYGKREISVGGSFGVAMLRSGDRHATTDGIQRLADAAMYEAKRAGGGVHLHGPECAGASLRPTPSPALVRITT
jgi:diguanylate cyclase (GGDEF)-like protein